jgi:hypothetical protein
MIKRISFIIISSIALLHYSCETEFSLNGDYEETPIVFGLLDHSQELQLIKITKAFLGDGDNLVYAKTPDSNYFAQVNASIVEYKDDEETGRSWKLYDTIIKTKSTDGIFYAPEQKVYAFRESELDPSLEYRLVGDVNEGKFKLNASTTLIDGFKVNKSLYQSGFKVNFADLTVDENDDYNFWRFEVTEATNAKTYEIGYTFTWKEYYTDGTTAIFSAKRKEETETQVDPSSPGSFQAVIQGIDFYRWIQNTIPDDDKVMRRTVEQFDLNISVAHEELDQYMTVSQPVSSIAQVQPEFTNIQGGYGLFSSRLVFILEDIPLSGNTIKELCRGQFTVSKVFCSELPEHATETFSCVE